MTIGHLSSQATANSDVVIAREWLEERVSSVCGGPGFRRVVVVGEPGAGKSVLARRLAERWACPRYFLRTDSAYSPAGADARHLLVSLGEQLFSRYGPGIFGGRPTHIRVRAGYVGGDAEIVGRVVDELVAPPFGGAHEVDVQVLAATGRARVVAERVRRVVDVTLAVPEATLLHLVLLDPLRRLAVLMTRGGRLGGGGLSLSGGLLERRLGWRCGRAPSGPGGGRRHPLGAGAGRSSA